MISLATPSLEQTAHSAAVFSRIETEIATNQGWISFARYMELVLYAPGLGYYSAGATKFGCHGDFVTAPEISPLFGQTLARQVAQVLRLTGGGEVVELGAGTGRLAGHLLAQLHKMAMLPKRYAILEVSAGLRSLQHENLKEMLPDEVFSRVVWLDVLPRAVTGLVLGNEVLDALPVHLFTRDESGLLERGVCIEAGQLAYADRPLPPALAASVAALDIPFGYVSEICPAAGGLVASLAAALERGVLLWLDYGFPRHEFYHPQRSGGTLMCHYRHQAHDNPFLYPGLQDVTAHVDFTAVAEAGVAQGLQLLGYATQAQFLINCGITELLAAVSPTDAVAYLPLAAAAQKLLSPAEMGELFKVMALGRGVEGLQGFVRGDKRHTL